MNVEKRSIDFIPETERHGEPRSLLFVWFGANANITTVAAGVLPVSLGLNLFWSALSILLGSLIGAIFMASHSAQGPRLGIPQMIQSRAQFGVFGAIVPLLFVMFIYLGFFVSNTLLATQAVAASSPLSSEANIVLLGLLCFLVALFGYKLIHRLQKMLSLVSVVFFGIATLLALALPIDAEQWTTQGFNLASFLASVSIAVTWQLSYAPYVADYSRYLPTQTSARQVFWYSYAGTVIGGSWMMLLGAILTKGVTGFSDNVGLHLLSVLGVGLCWPWHSCSMVRSPLMCSTSMEPSCRRLPLSSPLLRSRSLRRCAPALCSLSAPLPLRYARWPRMTSFSSF